AELLHEGDRARPRRSCSGTPDAATLEAEDCAKSNVERAGDEPRVPGEKESRPAGEREDPLAHGHVGSTRSKRCVAVPCMRRVVQEGQKPRPLQEKATSNSSPHEVQRTRAKPWARMPQARCSVCVSGNRARSVGPA